VGCNRFNAVQPTALKLSEQVTGFDKSLEWGGTHRNPLQMDKFHRRESSFTEILNMKSREKTRDLLIISSKNMILMKKSCHEHVL
jgi:hypothetical protein